MQLNQWLSGAVGGNGDTHWRQVIVQWLIVRFRIEARNALHLEDAISA
jgi:hypothetical protein